jgi:hypothetical protein
MLYFGSMSVCQDSVAMMQLRQPPAQQSSSCYPYGCPCTAIHRGQQPQPRHLRPRPARPPALPSTEVNSHSPGTCAPAPLGPQAPPSCSPRAHVGSVVQQADPGAGVGLHKGQGLLTHSGRARQRAQHA